MTPSPGTVATHRSGLLPSSNLVASLMVTSVSTLLDAARGDLVLRILGTSRHGQVVRVRSPKCTIGAGPHCTVRLRARGLYPLHCLILRGAGTTIIRRWAPDTLLNGETFTDAPLVPGDRVSIGRIQLEVVTDEPAVLPPVASPLSARLTPPAPASPAPKAAALQARLSQAQRQGHQRVRRLLGELRAIRKQLAESQEASQHLTQTEARARSEVADREQQLKQITSRLQSRESELTGQIEQLRSDLAKLESQRQQSQRQHTERNTDKNKADEQSRRRIAELEKSQKQLQSECETLRKKQVEWELASAESYTSHQAQAEELERQKEAFDKQRQRDEAELAERRQSLDTQAKELQAQREALDQERQGWEKGCADARQRVDKQLADLAAQQVQLQVEMEALERKQRSWEEQKKQFEKQQELDEAQRAERRQALEAQAQELRLQRAVLEQEQQRWKEEQAEAQQRREESEKVAEPNEPEAAPHRVSLDSLDVFRRLGTVPQWDEEPEATAPTSAAPLPKSSEPTAARSVPQAGTQAGEHADHEDESVDAYMARLLQRVRGETPSPATPPQPERPPVSAVETPALEADEVRSQPVMAHIKPATPVSLAPRAVAPEKSADLTAMRQLANYSAQVALGTHAQGQMAREGRMKLAVVGVSLAAGLWLLWAWWFRSAPNVILHAANLSFLIALIWGVQYAILTGRMIINRAGRFRWLFEPTKPQSAAVAPMPEEDHHGLPEINEMLAQYHAQATESAAEGPSAEDV